MRLMVIAVGASLAGCAPGDAPVTNNEAVEVTSDRQRTVSEEPQPEGPPLDEVAGTPSAGKVSACLMQGHERLESAPIKALGTEPFWGARVEGRCITYSTPESQAGTRIWTQFRPASDARIWMGTFENKPFKLVIRTKADCSDGMSDRIYPMEAILTVAGEERRGCAIPE